MEMAAGLNLEEFWIHGSLKKDVHDEQGVNSRLGPIQAAVLNVKLTRLDEWNSRRQTVARTYRTELPERNLLQSSEGSEAVHLLMVIRVEDRDRVRGVFHDAGIETGVHYPTPPHRQQAYREMSRQKGWSIRGGQSLSPSSWRGPR
jgi:dTDP-3-amino-3,4,6-trideoxy-alpha-D-glucose transaminase